MLLHDTKVPFALLLAMEEQGNAVPYHAIWRIVRTDGVVLFSASAGAGSPAALRSCLSAGEASQVGSSPLLDLDAPPELPDALWQAIMRFVSTRDVCMLARVSRALRRAASAPAVWILRYTEIFGGAPPQSPGSSAAEAALVQRRACRRSELRAARWLEASPAAFPLGGAAVCVALDAGKVACGERDCVRVYGTPGAADAADAGRKLGTLRGHAADVTCVAVSEAELLSGDAGGTLRLWGADDFKLRRALRGHVGTVAACLLLPGGAPVSAGADGTVRLWHATAPAPLAALQCDTAVAALAVDAGATGSPTLLFAGGGFLDCFDIATATRVSTLLGVLDEPDEPNLAPVTRLAAHGTLLAAGSAGCVTLWDVRAGARLVACLPSRGGGLHACGGLQLDDWKLCAAFGGDDDVCVHDIRAVATGSAQRAREPLLRLPAGGRVAALSFCGSVLLAALEGRPCIAWSFGAPPPSGAAAAAEALAPPVTPDADGEAGRAERRKKGVVPKIRGRFPKRSTR